MRLFMNAWFARFVRKQRLPLSPLVDAIRRANAGQIDADLGGGVIKQRIARPGQGKSGGYRTIIFFRHHDRAFFIYGFSKSDLANLTESEERQFKEAARRVLALTGKELTELVRRGDFLEIAHDDEEISQ
ncbi:MAG: addiction module toxin RelE [Tistrella sp.]|nr:addiction module toxin RelE [Tistrella sp.]